MFWVILLIECNMDTKLVIWAIVRSNVGKGQVSRLGK